MSAATGGCRPFNAPAFYEICVQGSIPATWEDRLEGMTVQKMTSVSGATLTVLLGMLADQSTLSCVLNTLFEMQLPVLSVARIKAASLSEGQASNDAIV